MDELAAQHGFTYEVVTAGIDEKAIREPHPRDLVLKLGHAKAAAIREKLEAEGTATGLLITCDQVVVHQERILEKPENEAEVRQ
jgi:septum formation protein